MIIYHTITIRAKVLDFAQELWSMTLSDPEQYVV